MPDDIYNSNGGRRYPANSTAYRGQRDYSVLPRSPSEVLEPDRAPEPPKGSQRGRQRPIVVFLNRVISVTFVSLVAIAGIFYYLRVQFDRPGPLSYPTVFVVQQKEGVSAIARRLVRDGIITDRWTFFVAIRYFRVQSKIKAGEYNIKTNASLRDVLDTLVEGKSILYGISIPEGLTSYQIVERLRNQQDLVGDLSEIPPEGSLLPDTYRFARGTSREEMVRRMQGEQQSYINDQLRGQSDRMLRELGLTSAEQVINLAAIVEKEASRADERPRVAAVYRNRLQKHMQLQADPTVIYGVSQGKGVLGRPLLKSELEEANPYNTYRNFGLPPTPIANPGRAAIEAVLHPAKTADLFFVADGTGGHVFAETYADHLKNVTKWRKIERDRAGQDSTGDASAPSSPIPSLDKFDLVEIPLPQRNPKH